MFTNGERFVPPSVRRVLVGRGTCFVFSPVLWSLLGLVLGRVCVCSSRRGALCILHLFARFSLQCRVVILVRDRACSSWCRAFCRSRLCLSSSLLLCVASLILAGCFALAFYAHGAALFQNE